MLLWVTINCCIGAFVAAPFGGLLWAFGACALRISFLWVMAKVQGHRFDAFDRPIPRPIDRPEAIDDHDADAVLENSSVQAGQKGTFFWDQGSGTMSNHVGIFSKELQRVWVEVLGNAGLFCVLMGWMYGWVDIHRGFGANENQNTLSPSTIVVLLFDVVWQPTFLTLIPNRKDVTEDYIRSQRGTRLRQTNGTVELKWGRGRSTGLMTKLRVARKIWQLQAPGFHNTDGLWNTIDPPKASNWKRSLSRLHS